MEHGSQADRMNETNINVEQSGGINIIVDGDSEKIHLLDNLSNGNTENVVCHICDRTFSDFVQLQEHVYNFHIETSREHLCEVCHTGFGTGTALKLHMRSHSKPVPAEGISLHGNDSDSNYTHVCKPCQTAFPSNRQLTIHAMRYHRNYTTVDLDTVMSEESSSNKKKDDIEEKISSSAIQPDNQHISALPSEVNTTVDSDSSVGERNDLLISNPKLQTLASPEEHGRHDKHSCQFCSKKHGSVSKLREHEEKHINGQPFTHDCTICQVKFMYQRDLWDHRKTHTDQLKWPCDICGHRFRSQQRLKRHMLVHTGEQQQTCVYCSKILSNPLALKRHMIIHSECTEPGKMNLKAEHSNSSQGTIDENESLDHGQLPCPSNLIFSASEYNTNNSSSTVTKSETLGAMSDWMTKSEPMTPLMSSVHLDSDECSFEANESVSDNSEYCPAAKNGKNKTKRKANKRYRCDKCDAKYLKLAALRDHMMTHTTEASYKCDECGKFFFLKEYLRNHILMVHKRQLARTCNTCHRSFVSPNRLAQHIERFLGKCDIMTVSRPHKCQQCDMSFVRPTALKKHENMHKLADQYHCDTCMKLLHFKIDPMATAARMCKCSYCDKQFEHPCAGYEHKLTHKQIHPDQRYVCNYCGKGFMAKKDREVHERVHTGSRPYSCDICGLCFKQKGHLTVHFRKHTGLRPYQCLFCDQKFSTSSGRRKHHRCVHKVVDVDEALKSGEVVQPEIPQNKKTGSQPRSKEKTTGEWHQKGTIDSPENMTKYQCIVCHMEFKKRYQYREHMIKIHKNDGLFICNDCNKTFTSSRSLKNHNMRYHQQESISETVPCALNEENNDSQVDDSLQIDQKYDSVQPNNNPGLLDSLSVVEIKLDNDDNRKFSCRFCEKNFTSRNSCSTHERVHTGEKPYECPVCGQRYKQSAQLKEHVATHSQLKPFLCLLCDKEFSSSANCGKHYRTVHKLNDVPNLNHNRNSFQQTEASDINPTSLIASSDLKNTGDNSVYQNLQYESPPLKGDKSSPKRKNARKARKPKKYIKYDNSEIEDNLNNSFELENQALPSIDSRVASEVDFIANLAIKEEPRPSDDNAQDDKDGNKNRNDQCSLQKMFSVSNCSVNSSAKISINSNCTRQDKSVHPPVKWDYSDESGVLQKVFIKEEIIDNTSEHSNVTYGDNNKNFEIQHSSAQPRTNSSTVLQPTLPTYNISKDIIDNIKKEPQS